VARDTKYQFVFKADGKEVVPRALPQLEPTTRLQFKGEAGIGSSVDFVFNAIPRVSAWSMEIVDKKNGKVVRQLSENAPLPKEFSWDGRTTEGTLADTNARYIYRLSVKYPDESEMTFSEDIAAVFAVPFKPKAGGQGLLVKGILFEFNSALLKPEMEDKIRAAAQLMRKFGDRAEVVCEGHSDEVGSKIFNQELSKRRAIMIRNHLAKLAGVEPNSIEVRGFGKTRPEAVGANESARAKNRRVEIRIVFPLES
jgi:outer membrane protein OmpA-like peptidoglycan-associated protein